MNEKHVGYLSINGYKEVLLEELKYQQLAVVAEYGDLLIVNNPESKKINWVSNIWQDVQTKKIVSINDGANTLKALQRNWFNYPFQNVRRMQLIQDALPKINFKKLDFLTKVPTAPLGSFTLIDYDTMLYSQHCSSLFPNGLIDFNENKIDPPSRAYLKLWEFFTVKNRYPSVNEVCIDLGSCPGGWTYVLLNLGATVHSVDKAPLDERLMNHPKLKFLQQSAFGLKPSDIGKVDWLFSDIICYPSKLLQLVKVWYESGLARNFVCTIKCQAETDFATIEKFLEIPGSDIIHLNNNKHEITWFLFQDSL